MAGPGRYTQASAELRIQIKFKRKDLLWKTDIFPDLTLPIISPPDQAFGPTLFGMLVRTTIRADTLTAMKRLQHGLSPEKDVVVWQKRNPNSLFIQAHINDSGGYRTSRTIELADLFQPGLASGGRVVDGDGEFTTIEKSSTLNISDMCFRLAVGMHGSIQNAYAHISDLAAQTWATDIERGLRLWNDLESTQLLVEDAQVAALCPVSSISYEVERQILRQACIWLGVDPALDCRRPRGRPTMEDLREEGEILQITVNSDNQVLGVIQRDFHGQRSGTLLALLDVLDLVELLGALRSTGLDVDGDLLEAYLDARAADWREQAAAATGQSSASSNSSIFDSTDPYEILGVSREDTLEAIEEIYRNIMNKFHPDKDEKVGRWIAQMVSQAIRAIRKDKRT